MTGVRVIIGLINGTTHYFTVKPILSFKKPTKQYLTISRKK